MSLRKTSRDGLVRQLEDNGYRFSELVLQSEGDYAADDSDWNYKDIPHLHHVHDLAESLPAVIGDDIICSINLQNIFGIWFPVALVNYELERYKQVYFTTLLFFALVIETHSESLGPIRTRVTTRYSIGSPPWLQFLAPMLKWTIRRNYKVLMSADVPMRDRRGELRKIGYGFRRKGQTYSFAETLNIMAPNLIAPPEAERELSCDLKAVFGADDTAFIGDRGLLGFRLEREGGEIVIFPRACPHEGASLDERPCVNGELTCEWHGRRIAALGRIPLDGTVGFKQGAYHVRVSEGELTITYLNEPLPEIGQAEAFAPDGFDEPPPH